MKIQETSYNLIELRAGDIYLKLPKTKANIKLFITALQNIENDFKKCSHERTETKTVLSCKDCGEEL